MHLGLNPKDTAINLEWLTQENIRLARAARAQEAYHKLGTAWKNAISKYGADDLVTDAADIESITGFDRDECYERLGKSLLIILHGDWNPKRQSEVVGDLPLPRDPPRAFPSQWSQNG